MLPADYRDPQGRGYGLWKTQEHSALLPCKLGGGGAVKIIFPKELLYRHDIPFSFDLAGSHSKLSVSA